MHGLRVELLQLQAESIGLPLEIVEIPEMPTMEHPPAARLELGVVDAAIGIGDLEQVQILVAFGERGPQFIHGPRPSSQPDPVWG